MVEGPWPGELRDRVLPFGGPDIGNALAFFPDADTYLLFGLRAPGAIPDLQALDADAIGAGLTQLETSLSSFVQVNYFFTRAMEKKLGKGSRGRS